MHNRMAKLQPFGRFQKLGCDALPIRCPWKQNGWLALGLAVLIPLSARRRTPFGLLSYPLDGPLLFAINGCIGRALVDSVCFGW